VQRSPGPLIGSVHSCSRFLIEFSRGSMGALLATGGRRGFSITLHVDSVQKELARGTQVEGTRLSKSWESTTLNTPNRRHIE